MIYMIMINPVNLVNPEILSLDGDCHRVRPATLITIDNDLVITGLGQRARPASRIISNQVSRARTHQEKPD